MHAGISASVPAARRNRGFLTLPLNWPPEPIGWKWSEKSNDLVKKKMAMGGGGGNAAPPKDALKKLEKPKPKREGIKL